MKKLYSFTTLPLALLLLVTGASAQTYNGGVYTAVRNGYWHNTSGPNPWATVEPPANCINCSIIISSTATVHLNTSVTLSGSSQLTIGTDNSGSAALVIDRSANAVADFASGNNLILVNDGSTPANSILLANSSSFINASGLNTYDGVLTNSSTLFFKALGNSPQAFSGNSAQYFAPASYGTSLVGPVTLSAIGTLPIILSAFNATLNNKEVDLAWTTDLEVNADHFAIERSADAGAHWQVLGTVAAKGNSAVASNYSFTDANPVSGTSEYRLQSVDKDAKFTYSEIRTIRNGLIGSVNIFPNPAKDYVNITLGSSDHATGNLSIRLISQSGQLLVEKKVNNAGGTIVSLPVSSYPQGNYLIQVTGPDGTQQISKLFISRQ
ncbi:MAG TPA: T9SS type A sorting domain-containing protein [Puia sp.]